MATCARSEDASDTVNVLVVDTSETAAGFVADALEFSESTLAVKTARDAESALERIEEERVDCVVCEYHLDGPHGLDFLDRARERNPELRGVIHTIDDDPTIAEEAWDRGFAYARKGHDVDRYGVIARHIVGRGEDVEL